MDGDMSALLAVIGFVFIGIAILTIIPIIIGQWIIFDKMYKLPGWYSIIPFFGAFKQSQMTFGQEYGWIGLIVSILGTSMNAFFRGNLGIFGLVCLVIYIFYEYKVLERLTDNSGKIVLAIILPFVGIPVIASSKDSYYKGPKDCFKFTKDKNE